MTPIIFFLFIYYIFQIYSMMLCVCSVIVHRGCQIEVRTSVTHSANGLYTTFFILLHY